jgi:acetate kinase
MADLVLALNAGSSSVKCALYETTDGAPAEIARRAFEGSSGTVVGLALDWAESQRPDGRLIAAGHRVVHGGMRFAEPVRATAEVVHALEALTPLAPLHQPGSLAGLRRLAALRPDLPQIACFDTAFHRTQPELATWLGLPRDLHERGVRRYGFHGLNYEHMVDRLAQIERALARGRVIGAHLGAGASLCALKAGKSVDTTMGFSPLDGLMMATRPGTLDAGAVLYLLQHEGLSSSKIESLLYRRSGLLGVSEVSGDMRTLLASDRSEAREAVAVFVYRAAREAAALVGVLEGLDGIVFTGGIGEHSPQVRAMIAARLAWTGLVLDPTLNARASEGRISAQDSKVAAWVIPADEERIIARHTLKALAQ